jgi:hypothetical protein
VEFESEKPDIQTKDTNKLASKKQPPHVAGRREVPHKDGQKQQTKTTKHTIEFSNNRLDCSEVPVSGQPCQLKLSRLGSQTSLFPVSGATRLD